MSAQDLVKIKKQNVFFILFDSKNEFIKKTEFKKNNKYFNYNYSYYFYNDQKNKKVKATYSFKYDLYWTFDDAASEINKKMNFQLNKSFLRKNKDIIITYKLMEKLGEKKVINLLSGINKHIFLIDISEIKGKKISLKEVRIDFLLEM